ncbi:hypothetical protein D3C79_1029000 [compost metagenome]
MVNSSGSPGPDPTINNDVLPNFFMLFCFYVHFICKSIKKYDINHEIMNFN